MHNHIPARSKFWEEVHFQRFSEFRISPSRRLPRRGRYEGCGAEGDVDVGAQHLRDVRARDVHALRERGLIEAQLLHPAKNLPKEERADSIYRCHSSQV